MQEELGLLSALLLLSHEEGDIDEEELLLLLVILQNNAFAALLPPLQFVGRRLCLDSLDAETCLRRFRFRKSQMYELFEAMDMPVRFVAPCRTSWSSMEGLLVLVRRLAYPSRLGDLCEEFGRSKPVLSLIFNSMLVWLWERWGGLITDPFTKPYFTEERIDSYANAVATKAGADLRIWGFIDGTLRAICRPDQHQKEYYSGHKRFHALKYQGVTTPDGLIASLHGPFEGKRHDAGVYARSGLRAQLHQHMNFPGGGAYALFGDSAYPLSLYLQKGFQGIDLTHEQQAFNTRMSSVRQAAEWTFGEINTLWAYVDMRRQQKVGLQPVGMYYRAAALLTNFHVCLQRGNQTSDYFQMAPPQLREYMTLQ